MPTPDELAAQLVELAGQVDALDDEPAPPDTEDEPLPPPPAEEHP